MGTGTAQKPLTALPGHTGAQGGAGVLHEQRSALQVALAGQAQPRLPAVTPERGRGTAPVPSAAFAHAPCAAGVTLGGLLVRAGGRLRAGGASGGVPGPVSGYPLQPGALSTRGERLQEEALGQQLPALSWVCLSAGCGAGSPSWLQ